MNTQIPRVPIELWDGDKQIKRTLVYDFSAMAMIADELGDNPMEAPQYKALPVMLWAMLSHEGKEESPADFQRMLGPANVEYFAAKVAEAAGAATEPAAPTKAKAKSKQAR